MTARGAGPATPAGSALPAGGFPRPDWADLDRYAPDRRLAPVDLSDNTSLWGPHPAAADALARAGDDALTRYPSVYADALRDAAARRWGVPEAAVVTGCGSDDLLDSALRAATAGGGVVTFPAPTFSMVETFARMNGLEPALVPWDDAVADPGALLRPGPAAIYLCSPNNPTGAELEPGWIRALLEARGPDGPPVLLDEAYADFGAGSLLAEAPVLPRLLVLRTLSKAYGLAGLRVGLGVGEPALVAEIEKSRGPYKVSRPAELAARAALEDGSGWAEGVVAEAVRVRARLAAALRERGLAPLPSAANFVLVPVGRPAAGSGGAAPSADALALGLRDRGVAVRPFPALSGVGDAIRVTVGPWPLIERFLEALDDVLVTDPPQPPAPAEQGHDAVPDPETAP